MRVLYVAMADDYGRPELGPSFEETNFKSALVGMGHDLVCFDFMARERAVGREAMNRELVATAREAGADVAFFVLFQEQLAPETIRAVGRAGRVPTINWFADDHWRFDRFTRHYAPAFDWSVTTDEDSLPRYRGIGVERVILSQWACNRHAYSRVTDAIEHQVTFVGQSYGDRPAVIGRVVEAGFPVECWGRGWPAGKIDHEGMVRVFASSRINVNLSSSFRPEVTLRMRLGALLRRVPLDTAERPSQIKGRTFEVPGCGGFLLTDRVPHLERYLEPGREIGVYEDADDLVEQVRYWLEHEDERAAVAEAGYRRVLAEHTYDHRFAAILAAAGLA